MSAMEEKARLDAELVTRAEKRPELAFYLEFQHLKQLYRQGWLRRGISREQCESVADHILGVTMLAWAVGHLQPGLDPEKLIRLALVHDLGEVFTGDIIPSDGIASQEKHQREQQAVQRLTARLAWGGEVRTLWEEYEANQTGEARLVHSLDRLEMALQALIYEEGGSANLEEFFRSAQEQIQISEVQVLLTQVLDLRRSGE